MRPATTPCGKTGSFARAFTALRNLRAAGSKISANTQLNARTLPDLEGLLELLAPEGIHAWQIQVTMAHGAAADHPEILLQPYQMLELYDVLGRIVARCEQLGITLYPGSSLGYFGPLEHRLRRTTSTHGHYFGCQAGISVVGISSRGDIKACPSLGEEGTGGSWREHGFAALWQRAPGLTYTRTRTAGALWGFCATCYYAKICMGGCTSISEPLLGRPGNNPMCHHRALELDRNGLRERLEPVQSAPGQPFDHGLYRLVCEYKDPELRERHGPVRIDEPRRSRIDEPLGPGTPPSTRPCAGAPNSPPSPPNSSPTGASSGAPSPTPASSTPPRSTPPGPPSTPTSPSFTANSTTSAPATKPPGSSPSSTATAAAAPASSTSPGSVTSSTPTTACTRRSPRPKSAPPTTASPKPPSSGSDAPSRSTSDGHVPHHDRRATLTPAEQPCRHKACTAHSPVAHGFFVIRSTATSASHGVGSSSSSNRSSTPPPSSVCAGSARTG